jgi:flagellar hook-basal body complex protein FliE
MNAIKQIVPIESIASIGKTDAPQAAQSSSGVAVPFLSILQDAVSNAQQTNAALDSEIDKLATGQTDDMHNALIASEKASLSVNMVVELRNKLLDAYKEIININV